MRSVTRISGSGRVYGTVDPGLSDPRTGEQKWNEARLAGMDFATEHVRDSASDLLRSRRRRGKNERHLTRRYCSTSNKQLRRRSIRERKAKHSHAQEFELPCRKG